MARIKPDPYMVLDRAQCEGALAEMAAIDRKLSAIENEMREAVDGAKAKASQLAGPLQATGHARICRCQRGWFAGCIPTAATGPVGNTFLCSAGTGLPALDAPEWFRRAM